MWRKTVRNALDYLAQLIIAGLDYWPEVDRIERRFKKAELEFIIALREAHFDRGDYCARASMAERELARLSY